MNSSLSSPSKLISQASSDDSSGDDDFDWNSYLTETGSTAAPPCNFRQALNPPPNEFNVGDKLETVDPRNQDSWCIGTIISKDGPRLRIRLDGTDDRNDFWRLVDSSEIRCYGTTAKLGGQIVPPLGFQQNSTRWAKYFDKNVKQGPFAAESCFKPQPNKPERNLFRKGEKLEAVDPKHPELICPATVSSVSPGDYRFVISLDGWSSSNNFKVHYTSRDIFPVGWCKAAGISLSKPGGNPSGRSSTKLTVTTPIKSTNTVYQQPVTSKKLSVSPLSNESSYSPTTMDERNNNLVIEKKQLNKMDNSRSINETDINAAKKNKTMVTVYLNFNGDNSGIALNPQKFRPFMPNIFGPADFYTVLTSIFDSCIKCSFQQNLFINRIYDLFPTPADEKKGSYVPIRLENGRIIYFSHLETVEDFWDIIRSFLNTILAGSDLFTATPPPNNNQSNCSSSSFLDSSLSPEKKDASPLSRSGIKDHPKRKSTEFLCDSNERISFNNNKAARSNSTEKSVHETKSVLNTSSNVNSTVAFSVSTSANQSQNGSTSRRPERYTPSEVASFIRGIDPSFDNLASRFLQEEIDGKALLLLTTDTLMRHMGLKLGPSLKIIHHIEKLKKS